MKTFKILNYILLILFLTGCESYDTRFVFKNETNKAISFFISQDSAYDGASMHFFDRNLEHSIVHQKEIARIPGPNWELWLASCFKDSTMNLFIIDSIYVGKDVDTIKNKITKYRLSLKEMQKSNWVFVYSGAK